MALKGIAPGVRISKIAITNLRFAHDIALLAECECLVNNIDEVSFRFELKIGSIPTEVQCIARDNQPLNVHLRASPSILIILLYYYSTYIIILYDCYITIVFTKLSLLVSQQFSCHTTEHSRSGCYELEGNTLRVLTAVGRKCEVEYQ